LERSALKRGANLPPFLEYPTSAGKKICQKAKNSAGLPKMYIFAEMNQTIEFN